MYKVDAAVSATLKCSDSATTLFQVTVTVEEYKGVDSKVVILNRTEMKKLSEIK